MPFDANLVLCDGSSSYDWTYANLVSYGAPVLTSRVGGFAVIDQLALSTMAASGMAAIFIADEAGGATDLLTLVLQGSDELDFVADATNPVRTLATFDIGGATAGVITGPECPCTVVRRFNTNLRYIRPYAVCTDGDNFYTCYMFLAPWPVYTL